MTVRQTGHTLERIQAIAVLDKRMQEVKLSLERWEEPDDGGPVCSEFSLKSSEGRRWH